MRGNVLRKAISRPVLIFLFLFCTLSCHAAEDAATLARADWLASLFAISPGAVIRNGRMAAAVYSTQNVTLSAPLANRSLLEYALPYAKLNTAAYADFGLLEGLLNSQVRPGPNRYLAEEPANRTDEIPWGFGLWAQAFGIYDELDKVKVLTNVSAGTGGWGPQCVLANGSVYGVATAYMVTFKGSPGKLGIFWRGTEAFSLRSYAETLCWWPVPLLPENGGPCPPSPDGLPCYVVSGIQEQFARLRDALLPTWHDLSGSDSPPHTVVCGGHSAGGAAAQISALYLKKMWPLANVASVNTASMFAGNEAFARYIEHVLGARPLGFTFNADIFGDQLPINFPPPNNLWARSEQLLFIQTNPFTFQSTCYDAPRPPGIYLSVLDHFPFNYVFGIENCILRQ